MMKEKCTDIEALAQLYLNYINLIQRIPEKEVVPVINSKTDTNLNCNVTK